jgi:CheY-like chemotaxis protein
VYHATNGKQAVELFEKHNNIDLILMDIKMPVMSGLEATQIIKKSKPGIPVIAITAYAMHGDENKALEAGCDDYITKPAGKEKLLQVIQNHCKDF